MKTKAALPEIELVGGGIITPPLPPGTEPAPPTPPLPASWSPNKQEAMAFTNQLWKECGWGPAAAYWKAYCESVGITS